MTLGDGARVPSVVVREHRHARDRAVLRDQVVDAADTAAVNALITQARELDDVVSTKTRLILDERRG